MSLREGESVSDFFLSDWVARMLVQRRVMSWKRVAKSLQAPAAHGLLFTFTLLLVLKLDHAVPYSWWIIFSPLWLFHVVVARGRFSLPAPSMPHDRHWAPFHAIAATPLLVAFELLLCIYLEHNYAVNLKIVFLPLLALETAILIDNIRMCKALMPGDDESISDEAIWETLPGMCILFLLWIDWDLIAERSNMDMFQLFGAFIHQLNHFWVAISMVFFIAATTFTLLKLCGDVAALGWWDLFINFGIAECFASIVCTRWYNPAIHRNSHIRQTGTSSTIIRYLDWNSGLVVSSDEDQQQNRLCDLQDIGGHVMKIPFVGFQILLFMRLEGTPSSARHIPIPLLFAPIFLLQGVGVLFALYRLVEKIVLLLHRAAGTERYLAISSKVCSYFGFLHHGSRLLGWWSIDEGSREEQARIYYAGASGYNTFAPDTVKKLPKSDLAEEIWRLQAALGEQTEITKFSQLEFERLQNEKILCRVCFDEQINMVLLPCRHHVLCSTCCDKCKRCPICRVFIEERLPVYDV